MKYKDQKAAYDVLGNMGRAIWSWCEKVERLAMNGPFIVTFCMIGTMVVVVLAFLAALMAAVGYLGYLGWHAAFDPIEVLKLSEWKCATEQYGECITYVKRGGR